MSQHDMNIANQGFPAFRADLNDALAALASTSTGATEPSTTFAQQLWYDSTANLLKMRNTDNDAWITLAYFDQTNDEWEIRSAVIQAVDSAGVVIKTDDGTTRLTIADGGDVTVANGLNVTGDLNVDSGTLFVDSSANNVGIGTSSPEGLIGLPATASNTPKFRLQSATTNTDFAISSYADANGTYVSLGANHYLNSGGSDAVFETTDKSAYMLLDARNNGAVVFGTNSSGIAAERMRIDSSGNVGIGTSSPSSFLQTRLCIGKGLSEEAMTIFTGTGSIGSIYFADGSSGNDRFRGQLRYYHADNSMRFATNNQERMKIFDSGSTVVIGTSSTYDSANVGVGLGEGVPSYFTRSGAVPLFAKRLVSDGEIMQFRKDADTIGAIGNDTSDLYIAKDAGSGITFGGTRLWSRYAGSNADDTVDLGHPSYRWQDVYATNGTIQTSDRNEKQDIEELSEAEQRVAVACKGLLRKFRWKSAVEEKGDDARIHFGIIAQDLQAAFEAEGLDAGRYAMFISSTWWETYTDVPAVEAQDAVYETVTIPAVTEERLVSEAVLDEEGNEIEAAVYETVVIEEERTEERLVSEAVEAKEAYTRTDTYETEEEAPEGAVKKSRMGVRYSELLAFIIAAI